MVFMRSYASIALCILFALLVHADQGNSMEGVTSRKEVSVSVDKGRKILVVKKDIFSPLVETNDYHTPRQHSPSPKGKHAQKQELKAKETEETGVMNLINQDYARTPLRPRAPAHA